VKTLDIRVLGDPILRQDTEPVAEVTDELRQLISDMFTTMYAAEGIGLAAPQVHEGVRLFVAGYDSEEGEQGFPRIALINPEITIVGDDTVEDWEGCLSIPEIRGKVPRAREIEVRAYDRGARRVEMTARNYIARVIQHETDHLDGILFLDRMTSFETLSFMEEFERYWSREEVIPE